MVNQPPPAQFESSCRRQALDKAGDKISEREREKKRIEGEIAFGPKPRLTARQRFDRIRPKDIRPLLNVWRPPGLNAWVSTARRSS